MSRIRFPMRSLDFSVDLILPAALCHWGSTEPLAERGSTEPLAEMSTRNLLRDRERPARKADLSVICEPIV
jgi:hypothetical protein